MRTTTLINEIIDSIEKLVQNIKKLYNSIKLSLNNKKKYNRIIYAEKYFQLEPYFRKFNRRSNI